MKTPMIKNLFLTEEMSPEQLQKVRGGFIRIGPGHWNIGGISISRTPVLSALSAPTLLALGPTTLDDALATGRP